MGIDAILKRYFPGVLCALLALAAYFQASGMGQLVASTVAVDSFTLPAAPPPRSALPGSTANQDHTTSAQPIISRNPFDSVTGPLDAKPAEPLPAHQVVENKDPYEDPPCDSAKVLLITQADDPEWSFAAMSGSDGKAVLRRQGDEIGGQKVYYVGWDRVWLTGSGARCQSVVGGKGAGPKVSSAAPVSSAPSLAPTADVSKPTRGGKKVPPEIAAKIHRVSETEFNVERSVVDQILENQSELMRSARIVPEKEGDKVVGIRMFGIRPDSLLGTLGLENGDRLSSINGFEMSDPQKALEAYARLRTADHLTVSVNRKGKPMNIDFNIK
jgi:general secretion pathway protein C